MRRRAGMALAALLSLIAGGAGAGEADVVAIRATETGKGVWRFDVTVRHDDAGWQHYADRWDVVGPDGTVLGSRELLHPHDAEQPFTRSLSGVRIPPDVRRVTVRAHDKVHGLGGSERAVELTPGNSRKPR